AYTWLDVFFAVLIVLARHDGWFARPWRARPLVAVGSVSYGLYLFQIGVLDLLRAASRGCGLQVDGWPALGLLTAAGAGAFGLAWLSFRFLEEPILRWGRRWQFEGSPHPSVSFELLKVPERSTRPGAWFAAAPASVRAAGAASSGVRVRGRMATVFE